jgi:tetratricopeptide (TPR) repeat protein
MLRQDRYREVQHLHLGFHATLGKKLGSEHPVTVGSLELKATLLGVLGLLAEEEVVLRQVLQTCLETLGIRDPATVVALENLGYSLARLKGDATSQRILETAIRFQLEDMKYQRNLGKAKEIVETISSLTQELDNNIKHDEAEGLLDCAQKLLGNVTTSKSESAFGYQYYRARMYKVRRQIQEAEIILRGLLRYYENSMSSTLNADVIDMLVEIMNITGRQHQAAFWLKKLYLLDVERYGHMHSYTMSSCKKTGFIYAKQRRYEEAMLFLSNVMGGVTSCTTELNYRMGCIREINTWMQKVLEMKAVADSMAKCSDSDDVEVGILQSNENVDCDKADDIPDPLSDL